MSHALAHVRDIFSFNSTLVRLGIEDLSNEDAVRRVRGGEGSSISFLVGHMASSRYGILKELGVTDENPFLELWGEQQGARDGADYPGIEDLARRWDALADLFDRTLAELGEDRLQGDTNLSVPNPRGTLLGALYFFLWHESYHVGQLGLLRTEWGYQPLQFRFYDFVKAREEEETAAVG
ncbi:MAG: DinB family protein [Gemmatimonadetes bacterium]|nr:MAG: DinB family protein [Gemmatimonadota bacterium]